MTEVVDLGPGRSGRRRVEHVFEREGVQVVVEGEGLDHVPGQAVDVHPADFGEFRAGLFEESGQAVVGKHGKLGALRKRRGVVSQRLSREQRAASPRPFTQFERSHEVCTRGKGRRTSEL